MIDARDDRTYRLLSRELGETAASDALTHFTTLGVGITASSPALQSDHGIRLLGLCVNLLSRFVGAVQVRTDPDAPADIRRRVEVELVTLAEADARTASRLEATAANATRCLVWVALGAARVPGTEPAIRVSWDGWACYVSTDGTALPEPVNSRWPFGLLNGAAFAIAEVFKRCLTAVENEGVADRFSQRLVRPFGYSALTKSWLDSSSIVPISFADRELLSLDGVTQVGAGAVGNGSALALSWIERVSGIPRVVDPKVVTDFGLNRCPLYWPGHVGVNKAVALVTELAEWQEWEPASRAFDAILDGASRVVITTVDNNAARHAVQEALPQLVIEGATNSSQVSVSSHNGVDGRPCLICLHPNAELGGPRVELPSVEQTAQLLGLGMQEVAESRIGASSCITDAIVDQLRRTNPMAAQLFSEAAQQGRDVCGALGEFRRRLAITKAPQEPSIGFASLFAGVNAAATAVMALLAAGGLGVPTATADRIQVDLLRLYTRLPVTQRQEPVGDCRFCVQRRSVVQRVWRAKWTSN
jgi:hypothetical protein